MEATKKKKAYIKPRMEKFEMKMETAFLAGSKGEVIEIPEEYYAVVTVPQCTSKSKKHEADVSIAKNLTKHSGSWFSVNPEGNSCTVAWAALGFSTNDEAYIYYGECNGTDTWWISHNYIDPNKIKCD